MRAVTVAKIPACDFCGEPALYDAPTVSGRWANMCKDCAEQNGGNLNIGSSFKLKEPVEKTYTGQTVRAIERTDMEYLEAVTYDEEFREPECPLCGTSRTVEPDCYSYTCDCGAKVKCPFLI